MHFGDLQEFGNASAKGVPMPQQSIARKIIRVDAIKGHRISTDLRLNAFIIQLSYGLLNALRDSLVTSSERDEQENCRGGASSHTSNEI